MKGMELLADYADAEFEGKSFNGPSLMATLKGLDAAAAAAESSFEGYSAWSIALHVAECKHIVARSLLGEAAAKDLGPYPYPAAKGGFIAPPETGAEAWGALLAYLEKVHRSLSAAIRGCGDEDLNRDHPEWKAPNSRLVPWVCGHDSYHNAQVRNMGIASLREKRAY